MKVLYFKARQLLYSYEYLKGINQSTFGLTQSHLLKSIQPDVSAAEFLIDTSKRSGYLLYPIDNDSIYKDLLDSKIFPACVLAPEIAWTCRLKLDDADPVRRLLKHVHTLKVGSWFICGDVDLRDHPVVAEHHIAKTLRNNSMEEIREAVTNTLQRS